jgi:Domain of unknown function (DUF4145)
VPQRESAYVPPTFGAEAFNCPQPGCGAYAHQTWAELGYSRGGWHSSQAVISTCQRCGGDGYWLRERLVDPPNAPAPLPHGEMPEPVQKDYMEAREVVATSPRSACALLRLALQKLCAELGQPGKNINADIGALVSDGLPAGVQQALDALRVIGNNAVHPGELDLSDDTETALALFDVMNYIVDQRIAQPKRLEALYDKLPEGAREAIAKRDAPSEEPSVE